MLLVHQVASSVPGRHGTVTVRGTGEHVCAPASRNPTILMPGPATTLCVASIGRDAQSNTAARLRMRVADSGWCII